LPALSVATAVMVFAPSVNITSALHMLQSTAPLASTPFTVTDAIPDRSDAVPVTMIVSLAILAPLVGDIIVRTGGMRSVPDKFVRSITRPFQ